MSHPAPIIVGMKSLLSYFTRGQEETYYKVSKDGALILDRDALLQSGKMKRQLDAARELKKQAARTSRRARTAAMTAESVLQDK